MADSQNDLGEIDVKDAAGTEDDEFPFQSALNKWRGRVS